MVHTSSSMWVKVTIFPWSGLCSSTGGGCRFVKVWTSKNAIWFGLRGTKGKWARICQQRTLAFHQNHLRTGNTGFTIGWRAIIIFRTKKVFFTICKNTTIFRAVVFSKKKYFLWLSISRMESMTLSFWDWPNAVKSTLSQYGSLNQARTQIEARKFKWLKASRKSKWGWKRPGSSVGVMKTMTILSSFKNTLRNLCWSTSASLIFESLEWWHA